jgi:hypothetical protein
MGVRLVRFVNPRAGTEIRADWVRQLDEEDVARGSNENPVATR